MNEQADEVVVILSEEEADAVYGPEIIPDQGI